MRAAARVRCGACCSALRLHPDPLPSPTPALLSCTPGPLQPPRRGAHPQRDPLRQRPHRNSGLAARRASQCAASAACTCCCLLAAVADLPAAAAVAIAPCLSSRTLTTALAGKPPHPCLPAAPPTHNAAGGQAIASYTVTLLPFVPGPNITSTQQGVKAGDKVRWATARNSGPGRASFPCPAPPQRPPPARGAASCTTRCCLLCCHATGAAGDERQAVRRIPSLCPSQHRVLRGPALAAAAL